HYKRKLPFWLSPVQIKILTITDEQKEYAMSVMKVLEDKDVRVEMDETSDQISGQIKRAQLERIPWMIVIGKKEEENKTVTIRYLDGKQEFGLKIEDIFEKIKEENFN